MSKKLCKPSSRTPGLFHINNPNLIGSNQALSKSKSYLTKIKEKQNQLVKEGNLLINEPSIEELTEKPYIYTDRSIEKIEISVDIKPSILNPEDEELLNVIRLQQPKAEMRTSPKLTSANYPSPSKSCLILQKCDDAEKDLAFQRSKYKRLQIQYNELLNKNSHIEQFYSDIILNLKHDLEIFKRSKPCDPSILSLSSEIKAIKSTLSEYDNTLNIIEEKLKNKLKLIN